MSDITRFAAPRKESITTADGQCQVDAYRNIWGFTRTVSLVGLNC